MTNTVTGWVVRLVKLKHRTFLTLWSRGKLQRVVLEGRDWPTVRTGSFVTVAGPEQVLETADDPEIIAEHLVCHSRPDEPVDRDGMKNWMVRAERLLARAGMLRCIRQQLAELEYRQSLLPFLVGDEATIGATTPFEVKSSTGKRYLTVNGIGALIESVTHAPSRKYSLGKLFWQQLYNNRYSLCEIQVLDLVAPGAARDQMLLEVEAVLRKAVLASTDTDPRLAEDLSKPLPRLSFDDSMRMAKLKDRSRGLPVSAGPAIAAKTGRLGFWVLDAPADHSPYYTRTLDRGDGLLEGRNFELWLGAVPNVVSGSEWAVTQEEVNPSAARKLADRQRRLITRGLPAGTGATLGLDRLAMASLATESVRTTLLHPRTPRSFGTSAPRKGGRGEGGDPTSNLGDASSLESLGLAMGRWAAVFSDAGFDEIPAPLLAPCPNGGVLGEVDWFGRRCFLVEDCYEALRDYLVAGVERGFAWSCPRRGPDGPIIRLHAVSRAIDDTDQSELLEGLRNRAIADGLTLDVSTARLVQPGNRAVDPMHRPLAAIPPHIRLDVTVVPDDEQDRLARWRCGVCGYICDEKPDHCPVCFASATAFRRLSKDRT